MTNQSAVTPYASHAQASALCQLGDIAKCRDNQDEGVAAPPNASTQKVMYTLEEFRRMQQECAKTPGIRIPAVPFEVINGRAVIPEMVEVDPSVFQQPLYRKPRVLSTQMPPPPAPIDPEEARFSGREWYQLGKRVPSPDEDSQRVARDQGKILANEEARTPSADQNAVHVEGATTAPKRGSPRIKADKVLGRGKFLTAKNLRISAMGLPADVKAIVDNGNNVTPCTSDARSEGPVFQWLANMPENVGSGETPSASLVSSPASDTSNFTNYRNEQPRTEAERRAVMEAIQHTYTDLGLKTNKEIVRMLRRNIGRDANGTLFVESYGQQYDILQAVYFEYMRGSSSGSMNNSMEQKKAEQAIGYLYEVEGPWRTGFT